MPLYYAGRFKLEGLLVLAYRHEKETLKKGFLNSEKMLVAPTRFLITYFIMPLCTLPTFEKHIYIIYFLIIKMFQVLIQLACLFLLALPSCTCLPQNYDDIDMSIDQPKGEQVSFLENYSSEDLSILGEKNMDLKG